MRRSRPRSHRSNPARRAAFRSGERRAADRSATPSRRSDMERSTLRLYAGPMLLLRRVIESAGPGWFTSVMGTGILGIDIVASPVLGPGGSILGAVVWAL